VELGHTLNGNAARMSVDPDNADDLTQWLTDYIAAGGWPESDEQHVPISELFPPRGFSVCTRSSAGRGQAQSASNVEHIRAEVVDLQVDADSVLLTLITASACAVPTPCWPPECSRLRARRRPIQRLECRRRRSLGRGGHAPTRSVSTVLIIGSGLTMVDAVVSLEQAGHRGPIEVFSATACCRMCAGNRRPGKIFSVPTTACAASAVAARSASAMPDRSPRASIGRRRWTRCAHIGRLWSQASEREKRQFVRHVRPWWEAITTARHR
jgi:uncharacterized NAD(P)/FAD-binding protein YdhS